LNNKKRFSVQGCDDDDEAHAAYYCTHPPGRENTPPLCVFFSILENLSMCENENKMGLNSLKAFRETKQRLFGLWQLTSGGCL
jgi:hypothetical protein